jgi:dTDP-4-amino-4,6-dideoxygalactose transaminase
MTDIQVADPRAGMVAAGEELRQAFDRVLAGGRYILGEEVEAFEREWAERCGTAHAVGVSSGTSALALALCAVGVEQGDEVLVPAMTALATWMAVVQVGAVPIGVDVDPGRHALDPELAKQAIGPRTRAIVAVHLFGQPADMDALGAVASEAGLPLVEDAAQAHGAAIGGRPAGSLADIAAFSFYPTKNLGALGDAGAVATSDPELADRVRLMREYGWRTRADAELKGVNARLDELQAALLRVLLERLDDANARRARIAAAYTAGLAGSPGLTLPSEAAGSRHAWHLYVVEHARRDALAERLEARGIGTAIHYAPPPHLTTAFRADGWAPGAFPVAERQAETALSLPLHPALSDADVQRVIEAVPEACAEI